MFSSQQINKGIEAEFTHARAQLAELFGLLPPPPPPPPVPAKASVAEYMALVVQWGKAELLPALQKVEGK